MSALWLAVLMLLGWTYTDQSGIVHSDNCMNGQIMLYEDMSYTVYDAHNVVSCIEYYYAPDSLEPNGVYLMEIQLVKRGKYYISEVYYQPSNCVDFPECLEPIESVFYLYTSRK